ncbi:MAG: hypothetical protein RIR00_1798, partial [Pseudomonadota bacterium]
MNPATTDPDTLAAALALAGIGLWQCPASGRDVHVSAVFNRQLGLGEIARDLPLEQAVEHLHPQDRPLFLARLEQRDLVSALRLRIRHSSGIWHWFQVDGQPLANGDMLLTFKDISEFKQVEAAALDSQIRYRGLYAHSPLAVILWNREGRITDWNRRAEAMFGWLSHEVIGKPIHRLLLQEQVRSAFN